MTLRYISYEEGFSIKLQGRIEYFKKNRRRIIRSDEDTILAAITEIEGYLLQLQSVSLKRYGLLDLRQQLAGYKGVFQQELKKRSDLNKNTSA